MYFKSDNVKAFSLYEGSTKSMRSEDMNEGVVSVYFIYWKII